MLPVQLAHHVLAVDYLPRLLSDHSPFAMSLSMPDKIRGTYRWRFKSTLLNQDDFVTFIKEQINVFTLTNKPSCTNKFILWETLKAYIKRQCIAYTKGLAKQGNSKLENLEAEITDLEKVYQKKPSKCLHRNLLNKKREYNSLNTYQAERTITRLRQRYYELGEKSHKVLAWQLKTDENKQIMSSIDTGKNITYNPIEINSTFREFYKELYSSQVSDDVSNEKMYHYC